MKVGKKKQNPSIFLATYNWNLSYKSGNLEGKKISSKSGEFGPLFSLKMF
jgi:hypothetical protein